MANATTKAAIFTLFLLFMVAESRGPFGNFVGTTTATIQCNSVHAVQSGETCSGVAQNAALTLTDFNAINPNLNCDRLFVGQWLCIDGSSN